MTDIEIDKALALAIGWKDEPTFSNGTIPDWISNSLAVSIGWKDEPNKMRVSKVFGLQVWIGYWANFSHKDWNVIGPIAERYNCFPFEDAFGRWFSDVGTNGKKVGSYTPQKAIALAVIGAKK